jgi:hypothetical protein
LTPPSTNLSVQRTALSISLTELRFHVHERSNESAWANYNQVPCARKRECFCCKPGKTTFQHICCSFIKGSLTRDFRLQVFSWISFPRAPEYPIGPFRIFTKIRRDIHSFVFIAGVIDTGD